MGFYQGHSHRIIDARHCLLQPEEFGVITDVFREWFENWGASVYNEETHKGVIRHLYLRRGEMTGEIMVCVVINADKLKNADKLLTMLRENVPSMTSFILNTNKEKQTSFWERSAEPFGETTLLPTSFVRLGSISLRFRSIRSTAHKPKDFITKLPSTLASREKKLSWIFTAERAQ